MVRIVGAQFEAQRTAIETCLDADFLLGLQDAWRQLPQLAEAFAQGDHAGGLQTERVLAAELHADLAGVGARIDDVVIPGAAAGGVEDDINLAPRDRKRTSG